MLIITGKSQLGSIAEVVAMLIVFILILATAYYVTKYFGKAMTGSLSQGNIHVIETVRLAPEKYLQIVEVTGRYFLLAMSKGNISLISELKEEDVKLRMPEIKKGDFKETLKKIIEKTGKK